MNQKLHTARSGIVILIALLCIVCLSLSLAFSAHFAAYAADEDVSEVVDAEIGMWLVSYRIADTNDDGTVKKDEDGNVIEKEVTENLWDGIRDDKAISYIASNRDANGLYVVAYGTEDDKDCFTPYRGVELTLKLNPAYELNGKTLESQYDLAAAEYDKQSAVGGSDMSTDITTSVSVAPKTDSGATEPLVREKKWTIVTLCNTVDVTGTYIGNRAYGEPANYSLLHSVLEGIVVYDLRDLAYQTSITVAIQYENGHPNYYEAGRGDDGRYSLTRDEEGNLVPWNGAEREEAAAVNSELINYLIRSRNALVKTEDTGAYVLTVTAMDVPAESGEIYYAQSSVNYPFDVSRQNL